MFFEGITARIRAMLRRGRLEAEMHEEMRLHLQHRIDEYAAEGLSIEHAERRARLEFGNLTALADEARDARGWRWRDHVGRDLRHAWRQVRSRPLFSWVAAGSIALCLGINAAVFAIVDARVLRPLPFPAADRIVEIYNTFSKVGIAKLASNVGQYLDYGEHVAAIESPALWRLEHDALSVSGRTTRIATAAATSGLFDLLSARPIAGRFFTPHHHTPATDKVVVLTDSFWSSRFSRDPTVIGTPIRLNGESFEIIGVAPAELERFDARIQMIRPFSWDPAQPTLRTGFSPTLLARLRQGATLGSASEQVRAREKAYFEAAAPRVRAFVEQSGQETVVARHAGERARAVRAPLLLLQAAALVVLVVAAANLLNLFVARTLSRGGEFRVRAALGASVRDVASQMAAEAGVIGALGLLGGLLVAWLAVSMANRFASLLLPGAPAVSLNLPVVAAVAGVASLLVLLITAATTVHLLGITNSRGHLQLSARALGAGVRARRLAGMLVVGQIGFALVVCITAVLLVVSYARVLAVPVVLEPESLLSLRIDIPQSKEDAVTRIDEALRSLPGVEACIASATPCYLVPPFGVSMPLGAVEIHGRVAPAGEGLPSVSYCGVTAEYAAVLGLKIRQGRWFTSADIQSGRAVVVDESFSRRYFPESGAIGQRIVVNRPPPQDPAEWQEIIGVVENVPHNGIGREGREQFVYLSIQHTPLYGSAGIIARTQRSAADAVPLLRNVVADIDPEIPVYAENTMAGVISDSLAERRAIMALIAVLGGVSVFLAALGVYATLAYDVSRRVREIGVRCAIGATRAEVVGMLMREGMRRTSMGVLAGAAVSLGCSRLLSDQLFRVAATDAGVYLGCIAAVWVVTCLASLVPAVRASRIDPMVALRAE